MRFGVTVQGATLEIWAWIRPGEKNMVYFEKARRDGILQGLSLPTCADE